MKLFCRHRKGTFVAMGLVYCCNCNKALYSTIGKPRNVTITSYSGERKK